jgi:hypothetical protein
VHAAAIVNPDAHLASKGGGDVLWGEQMSEAYRSVLDLSFSVPARAAGGDCPELRAPVTRYLMIPVWPSE